MGARTVKSLIAMSLSTFMFGCGGPENAPLPVTTLPQTTDTSKSSTDTWPPDDRRTSHYVGSRKCAECHEEIYRQYTSSHPMANSIRMPEQLRPEAIDSLPASFRAAGRNYTVAFNESQLQQSEELSDQHGQLYDQSCGIDFAIGSGTRGYTFVTDRDGCFYQAPITWYAQKNSWDLSPGYAPADHARFGRRISDACLACHSGRVNQEFDADNRFGKPFFHESRIGCERCHGPGEQHSSLQNNAGGALRDGEIVNPAKLSPARRDSVCFQCHLHGRERILRTHRTPYDFVPGDLLSDIWVTFVEGANADDSGGRIRAVSQAEQMVSSKCYQESQGNLGCISCHDPHWKPPKEESSAFFRGKCVKCHSEEANDCGLLVSVRVQTSPEDSCIECHMPAGAASDVPHTAQTDHRVLANYGVTQFGQSQDLDVFEITSQPLPKAEIARAFGLMLANAAATRRKAGEAMDMLVPFVENPTEDPILLNSAAWLLMQLGDLNAAKTIVGRVLSVRPKDESALESLSIIEQYKKNYDEAMRLTDLAIQLDPWNAKLHARKAELLDSMEKPAAASVAWLETLKINPLSLRSRERLIESLKAHNKLEEAESQTAILKRLKSVTDTNSDSRSDSAE